jgi:phosphatidylglycerol:prolipoprotein diacylglycerol transferase
LYPVIFRLGPITVYSFGVLMAVGFYFGALATVTEYKRRGGDPEPMWNLLVWIFLAGLVGARIFSLLNDPAALMRSPLSEVFAGSGFVWYGGLIGGILASAILVRRYQVRLVTLMDCCAPGLAIGQAIGRIGCHVSGDGDWGIPTTLPWGYAYENAIVGWDFPPGVVVHPTPIYEAIAYTLVFAVIWALRKRNLSEGTPFSLYLIGTSATRFAVEFIRINPRIAFGLTQAQLIAIVLFIAGAAWLTRNVAFARVQARAGEGARARNG